MAHKLESLTQRDRYQIGDWVLNNGKPYRWTAEDYNRSSMGMQSIEPMPMSRVVPLALGMKPSNKMYNQPGVLCAHMFVGEKEPDCDAYIYAINIYVYMYEDGRPERFILNAAHRYDTHEHTFIGNVNNVHELQAALRSVQLHEKAESIDLKDAEHS